VANEAALREVLGFIELHLDQWDPARWVDGYWGDTCGTVACLAGWTYLLRTRSPQPQPPARVVFHEASALLGLNRSQAVALFGYTTVMEDGPDNNGLGTARPPTFAELLVKVQEITGVQFKPDDTTALDGARAD